MKKLLLLIGAILCISAIQAQKAENKNRSVAVIKKDSNTKLYGFYSKTDGTFLIPAKFYSVGKLTYVPSDKQIPFNLETPYHDYFAWTMIYGDDGCPKYGLVRERQIVNAERIITNIQLDEVMPPVYNQMIRVKTPNLCWAKKGKYWQLFRDFQPITSPEYVSYDPIDADWNLVHLNPESFGKCFLSNNGEFQEFAIAPSGAQSGLKDECIWKRGTWGFVAYSRLTNTPINKTEYASFLPFHNGIAGAKQNGLWGLINSQGQQIVPAIFVRLDVVPTDSFYYVGNTDDGVFHYLSQQGIEVKTTPPYTYISPTRAYEPNRVYSILSRADILYGLMDLQNNPLTPCIYDGIDSLNAAGQRRVEIGINFGILAQNGTAIIPPVYRYISNLQDGQYYVAQNWDDLQTIYNTKGECLLKDQSWDIFSEIHNGIFFAMHKEDKLPIYKYLTVTGQDATPLQYGRIYFADFAQPGFTLAQRDTTLHLMCDGRELWPDFKGSCVDIYGNTVLYQYKSINKKGVKAIDGSEILPLQDVNNVYVRRQSQGWTYIIKNISDSAYKYTLYSDRGQWIGHADFLYFDDKNFSKNDSIDDCVPVRLKINNEYRGGILNLRTGELFDKSDQKYYEKPTYAGNRRIILASSDKILYGDYAGLRNYECIDANSGKTFMYVTGYGVGGFTPKSNIFWYHNRSGYRFWHVDGYNVQNYFASVVGLNNGYWLVKDFNGKWGMLDSDGKAVLYCSYARLIPGRYPNDPIWGQTYQNKMQIITQYGQIITEMDNVVGNWFGNYACKWQIVNDTKHICLINNLGQAITDYDWLFVETRHFTPIQMFALQNNSYSCTMDTAGQIIHYGTLDDDWLPIIPKYDYDMHDTTVLPEVCWKQDHTATCSIKPTHASYIMNNTYYPLLWHYKLQSYDANIVDHFPFIFEHTNSRKLPIHGFISDKHDTKYLIPTKESPLYYRACPMAAVNDDALGVQRYLDRNKVAQHIVADWFMRDQRTGIMNMHTLKRCGGAEVSEVLGRTFVPVHEIFYGDKRALILGKECFADRDFPTTSKNTKITITTYLFQLDWNDQIQQQFFDLLYVDSNTLKDSITIRKERFDYRSDFFHLTFIGQTTSTSPMLMQKNYFTEKSVINEKILRTVDRNMADLQSLYPQARNLYYIIDNEENGEIKSWFGEREGVSIYKEYEVLERVVDPSTGKPFLQRVATAVPSRVRSYYVFVSDKKPTVLTLKNATKPITSDMVLRELGEAPHSPTVLSTGGGVLRRSIYQ